jgi:hypothetical protein
MRAHWTVAACAVALLGCKPDPAASAATPATKAAPPAAPSAAAAPAGGVEHYGAAFAADVPAVALSALIAEPSAHAGKVIETEGTVSQVCQNAGCWMELSAAGSEERVRTPMAGHAFFLPKTVVGKRARVQGRVELIALAPAMKAHLESEGAKATSNTLSLSALAVAVQ